MSETSVETHARHQRYQGLTACSLLLEGRRLSARPSCPTCRRMLDWWRADMSVVDEDRLTRRNSQHLDDWRFR